MHPPIDNNVCSDLSGATSGVIAHTPEEIAACSYSLCKLFSRLFSSSNLIFRSSRVINPISRWFRFAGSVSCGV